MGYGLGTRFTISPPTHCNDMAVWLHRICVFFDRLFNIIDWFPTILSMAGGKVGKWFLNRINMIRLLAYSLYCQLQNSWYIYFLVQPSTLYLCTAPYISYPLPSTATTKYCNWIFIHAPSESGPFINMYIQMYMQDYDYFTWLVTLRIILFTVMLGLSSKSYSVWV